MKVAVTEASGFIGSHLVQALKGCGYDITVVTEPGDPVGCGNARGFSAMDIGIGKIEEVFRSAIAWH